MLILYKPEYRDLWFRQKMLSDGETMSYNHAWGGTIAWPEEEWIGWYEYWIVNPEGRRYYRYLKNEQGEFIGEIAYHYDAEFRHEMANVLIYAPYRGRGYGAGALDLLCEEAKENGVSELYDDIAIDNPAIGLFLRHGFTEDFQTGDRIFLRKKL